MRYLLQGFGEEFVRIRERMEDLLAERDPRQTVELLDEWEEEYGLPNKCVQVEQTFEERRDAVVSKVISPTGQSVGFFLDQAGALGADVTIEEEHGFRLGIDGMGDGLGGTEWNFVWTVHVVGDSNELLECVFTDLKPAHTVVHFNYEEVV